MGRGNHHHTTSLVGSICSTQGRVADIDCHGHHTIYLNFKFHKTFHTF
uniref:Uncharacterized protein n=1 Tax=Rhizophora mucronata TaxID=61149 RepID=A0A2P2PB29_RHIMU